MRFAPEPQMPLCPIRTQELRIRASQRPANRERPDRVDSGLFAGPTFARQIVAPRAMQTPCPADESQGDSWPREWRKGFRRWQHHEKKEIGRASCRERV